jgi:DNA repair protein RadC
MKMKYTLGFKEIHDDREIDGPKELAKYISDHKKDIEIDMAQSPKEVFLVVHLSEVLVSSGIDVSGVGNSKGVLLDAGDVFSQALMRKAQLVALVHNHPNEKKAHPTDEDVMFTKDMLKIARAARIVILDHLIIGTKDTYSFWNNKLIFTPVDQDRYSAVLRSMNVARKKRKSKRDMIRMVSKWPTGFKLR